MLNCETRLYDHDGAHDEYCPKAVNKIFAIYKIITAIIPFNLVKLIKSDLRDRKVTIHLNGVTFSHFDVLALGSVLGPLLLYFFDIPKEPYTESALFLE